MSPRIAWKLTRAVSSQVLTNLKETLITAPVHRLDIFSQFTTHTLLPILQRSTFFKTLLFTSPSYTLPEEGLQQR